MNRAIRKAVIPAAGIGSRLLPLTKAIPKEMLPVGDKPVIEHTVRELVDSGITDITIVVSGGKSLIQEHFRPVTSLVQQLRADGKRQLRRCRAGGRRALAPRAYHLPRPARAVRQRHTGVECSPLPW